ncbi:MAG: hypothetical protein C0467_06035 [Planctomycetaceae bacterium]|nr:hypothetical protein [Planctomycetaceae bacterium]
MSGKPKVCGPYGERYTCPDDGTQKVRLNPEGKRELEKLMLKHPNPISLLQRAWPGLAYLAKIRGFTTDEVNAACMEGFVRAFIRFNPERCAVSTVAAWGVRGAVTHMIRDAERKDREFDFSHKWGGEDGDAATAVEPIAKPEADPDCLSWSQDIIRKAKLNKRQQQVLHRRFADRDTLRQIGQEMSISKERVRQIEVKALNRLRKAAGIRTLEDDRRDRAVSELRPRILMVLAGCEIGAAEIRRACGTSAELVRATLQALRADRLVRMTAKNTYRNGRRSTLTRYRLVRKAVAV